MKNVIPGLSIGDCLDAEIIECVSETDLICSFQGDLLRVQNLSTTPMQPGQKITLQVLSIRPLKFATSAHSGRFSKRA